MKFIPFSGRIEIEPVISDSLLLSEDKKFIEKGRVITIGKDVSTFVKEGDVLYFDAYGVYQTPEVDGKSHWVLRGVEYIIGKDGE